MASPATSIPDTQLGLTSQEVQLLRQHQQIALSQAGRSSSRAASHASSQGRLLLDPSSLQALSYHFDRLMAAIQQRVQAVCVGIFFLLFCNDMFALRANMLPWEVVLVPFLNNIYASYINYVVWTTINWHFSSYTIAHATNSERHPVSAWSSRQCYSDGRCWNRSVQGDPAPDWRARNGIW